MSVRLDPALLRADATIVPPPSRRACEDHNFELPTGLYLAMAALLFGFLAVLVAGLANPGLIVPMAVNFAFLTAFFAVPAIFVRAARDGKRSLNWSDFMRRGIDTATGHSSAGEATVLVLLLPALIFCWSIAIVVINVFV